MTVNPRYFVPNFFTGLSFLLGVYSILLAASYYHPQLALTKTIGGKEPLILSAWLIIWCVSLDKMDGFAAKLMNASSNFGAQFDSLADLVAFGLAPGFLCYFYLHNLNNSWLEISIHKANLVIAVSIYVLCAAMRLARYNSSDIDDLGNYFMGLPSTFSGGFVSLSVILIDKYEILKIHPQLSYLIPVILITCGIFMVCPLYLPKLVKRNKPWLNMVQFPVLILGYIFSFAMIVPEFLFLTILIYGTVGFSYCYLKKGALNFSAVTKNPPS